jgi:transposase-like protein
MAETAPQYSEPHFYSHEFKLEAVRLSGQTDKSMAHIARELGVPERVLYRWRRQLREKPETAFLGKGHQSRMRRAPDVPYRRAGSHLHFRVSRSLL